MDSAHHSALLSRRGNRPTRQPPSCKQCQQRKIKCDRKFPCNRCTRGKRAAACSYAAAPAADGNDRQDGVAGSNGHGGGLATGNAVAHVDVDVAALARKVADLEQKVSKLSSDDGRTGVPRDAGPAMSHRYPEGGVFRKGRFFGRSHWMCLVDEFPGVAGLRKAVQEDADAQGLLERCKRLARELKARRAAPEICGPRSSVRELVPSRDVADQLVAAYLRTFETVFRIVHIPSFTLQYGQYWDDPRSANEVFVVQLLLILAIGTCFCGQEAFESLRSSTAPWVYAASIWLHSPVAASLVTIPVVQTRCLMLLARQTSSIGLDQIWNSAGSLLNAAMQLGLHRSPDCLPGTSAFEAEMRRRLWATVAELVVQTSIDAGAAPTFSHDDFDCEPPSNIDDDQLHEDAITPPTPKPLGFFTQTTTQILLLQSLPTRLEIAKHLNHFRSDGSYSTTLQLHAKLSNALPPQSMATVPLSRPTSSSAVSEHASSPLTPSPFQAKLLTLLTQRFLLALHQHFALQAHKDPTFHFSRTTCLATALILLSLSQTHTPPTVLAATDSSSSTSTEDTYALLARRASGTFREGTLRPAIAVCLQLVAQVNQHEHYCSFLGLETTHAASVEQQRKAIEDFVELARERVRVAGDAFKTYVVFFVILAIVGAVEKEEERMDWLVKAAVRESLDVCLGLLRERLHECGGGMTETVQMDKVTTECSVSIEGWEEMLGRLGADSDFSFDIAFPDTAQAMQGLGGAF